MKTLVIEVANKIARYTGDETIICGNADYQIRFEFDEEWSAHNAKVARFIAGGKFVDVAFTGNTCTVPVLSKVDKVSVGVYVDNELSTTTTDIPCALSVRCTKATSAMTERVKTVKMIVDCVTNDGIMRYTGVEGGQLVRKELVIEYDEEEPYKEIEFVADTPILVVSTNASWCCWVYEIHGDNKAGKCVEHFDLINHTFGNDEYNEYSTNVGVYILPYRAEGYYISMEV